MSINDYFKDWEIEATRMILTQAPDSNGNWIDTLTEGATVKGIKYNLSTNSNYRNLTWSANVSDAFVTSSSIFGQDDKIRISGKDYNCELPVNVACQGEVYIIGLGSVS